MPKKPGNKRGRVENLKPFSADNQPSSEAKKQWRERKKQAQKMMDTIMELQEMTVDELKKFVQENKKFISVWNFVLLKYVEDILKDKWMRLDRINRHIPYATAKQEVWHSFDWVEAVTVTIKKGKAWKSK